MTKKSRNIDRSYESYEKWNEAFFPKEIDNSQDALGEEPGEVGKMIASAMLQRFANPKKEVSGSRKI